MVWFSNKAVIRGHPAVNKDRQSQQNLLLNIIIIVIIFRVIYRRKVMMVMMARMRLILPCR